MDNVITLTRLNCIRTIDEDTPLVVLQEISRCHGVPFVLSRHNAVFYTTIRDKPIGIVHNPVHNDEWSIIAQYVNPDQEWSVAELQTAYNYLQNWSNDAQPVPPEHFTFGLQTPADPERLNACVLYAICQANRIPTLRDQTIYQLATVCQMFVRDENYARTVLYNTISHVPQDGLLELYTAASAMVEDIPEPIGNVVRDSSNYDTLEVAITTFNNKNSLRMRVHPRNYPDAIVLAALNFNIDISSARDPIREYSILYSNPGDYVPFDLVLRNLIQNNPHLIKLDEFFNPLLPHELYSEDILNAMANIEGYTTDHLRRESAYTLLQTAYMSCTFYHGWQVGIKNTRTPFLYEDIDKLDNDLIVCFGIRGSETMTAFRYIELGELFKEQRNFINPLVEEDTFPDIAIVKLKNLCKLVRATDTVEILEERKTVHGAIVNTELFTDATQEKARVLFEIHEQADEIKTAAIEDAILKLFQLSMHMRGWLGEGPYPIERAPVDNQAIVDLYVTQSLNSFESACASLENIGQQILELPVLKYRAGTFHPVRQVRGQTIKERLDIVKTGDDHDNYDSCIRVSSNLLAMTSYRYMEILRMRLPFQLDRLSDIS